MTIGKKWNILIVPIVIEQVIANGTKYFRLEKEVICMFSLNYDSREPIYEQLYNNVVKLVALGVLKPDEQLPTVRALAKDVGVNPNTVAKVYQMLERDKVIYSVVGRGSFIAPNASPDSLKMITAARLLGEAIDKAVELGITKDDINTIVKEYFEKGGANND